MAEVIVNVEQGKLRGKTGVDYAGKTFYSFQGIPYAKPPLGDLRFKDPQPAEPWEGIKEATKEGSVSYQSNYRTDVIEGSEDCLYLNVYTPQINNSDSTALKPVMFWIHGGGFYFGSANSDEYGPNFLVARDVVLVSINYRLGILGFLKLEDPSLEVPGNAGLKDMVQALRWVQSNIQNFNGDPNNVTIFGESAGSAAVHYLTFSPLAKGLFHKAILQSGCVFNEWAIGHYSKDQHSQALNLNTTDERNILKVLRGLSVDEVFKFQARLNDNPLEGGKRPYGPTVERPSSNAFLTEEPRKASSFNDLPLLIGYTDSEGIISVAYQAKTLADQPFNIEFEPYVPYAFNLEIGSEENKYVAQKIKEFYYKDKEPSLDTVDAFVNLESDCRFIHGVQKTLQRTVEKAQQPVFFYRFTFHGQIYFFPRAQNIPVKGAGHGDELGYLFSGAHHTEIKPGSPVDLTIQRLTKIWTNFARYGKPIPAKDELLNVDWLPVSKSELNYVNIGNELSTGVNPEAERVAFWDNLYEDYPTAKYW